jgi:hypothetical protein
MAGARVGMAHGPPRVYEMVLRLLEDCADHARQ